MKLYTVLRWVGILIVLGLIGTAVAWNYREQLTIWAITPKKGFDAASLPAVPDYAQATAWASLPGAEGIAGVVPDGEPAKQGDTGADVFFVHPTTYFGNQGWNAPIDEPQAAQALENGVLRYQLSAFNLCCRLFAPRYRQATLAAFADKAGSGDQALDVAYQDVERAFRHYLANHNQNRPFILASHSQGTRHAIRLLVEVIMKDEAVKNRMIAGYLVGYGLPTDLFDRALPGLKPCTMPTQTSCLVTWNSVAEGGTGGDGYLNTAQIWYGQGYERNAGKTQICVNPLSWAADREAVAKEANKGTVSGNPPGQIPAPTPGLTGARCDEKGLLRITKQEKAGLTKFVLPGDDYHFYDYSLFHSSIRANAAARVAAFAAAGK